jgi:hypothetical protein
MNAGAVGDGSSALGDAPSAATGVLAGRRRRGRRTAPPGVAGGAGREPASGESSGNGVSMLVVRRPARRPRAARGR